VSAAARRTTGADHRKRDRHGVGTTVAASVVAVPTVGRALSAYPMRSNTRVL